MTERLPRPIRGEKPVKDLVSENVKLKIDLKKCQLKVQELKTKHERELLAHEKNMAEKDRKIAELKKMYETNSFESVSRDLVKKFGMYHIKTPDE